jgi:hypothetical protein
MPDITYPPFLLKGTSNSGPFLGVCQGLFGITSKIRQLRERIRKRRDLDIKPHVDFTSITHAKDIDRDLKSQECTYAQGGDDWLAWQLNRTCFWLFLHRTINASGPNEELESAVSEAISYLQAIPPDSAIQSVLLPPIFMVGCSAFNKELRPAIEEAFDTAERYSELGNIKHARRIVNRMWELMDFGDPKAWDWEKVMTEMVRTHFMLLRSNG